MFLVGRRAALRSLVGGMAVVTALVALIIVADVGPLAPFPNHFAALALPLTLIVTAGGVAIFLALERVPVSLWFPAATGLATAIAVAIGVVVADPTPKVHYTLSH